RAEPDAHRAADDPRDIEAHERFVNGADLFDIERPVAEPFTAEVEEPPKDAVDRPVADAGDFDGASLFGDADGRALAGPAFEEAIAMRIEEIAAPRGKEEIAMFGAQEDRAEEADEAR